MNYPAASSGVSTISNRFFLAASCGEFDPKKIKEPVKKQLFSL